MIASGQLPPVIAVFPDDQGVVSDDSWWGDTPLGDTVETWLVNTLVPTIDAQYRTLGVVESQQVRTGITRFQRHHGFLRAGNQVDAARCLDEAAAMA